MDDHENDLPLMANFSDIHVYYFILDLGCHFDKKQLTGSVTLFCKPQSKNNDLEKLKVHNHSSISSQTSLDELLEQKTDTGNIAFDNSTEKQIINSLTECDVLLKGANLLTDRNLSEAATFSDSDQQLMKNTEHLNEIYSSPIESNKFEIQTDKEIKSNLNEDTADGFDNISVSCLHQCHHLMSESHSDLDFRMVLDACDIKVLSVDEIISLCKTTEHKTVNNFSDNLNKVLDGLSPLDCKYSHSPLQFSVSANCIKIWKDGVKDIKAFPQIVKINYETQPVGQSLKWTYDQDGKKCVFTHGHWINNRSLFPSQDVPASMATWEATVTVPDNLTVVMSGDDFPQITDIGSGLKSFYFKSSMPMPSSTLSLAIGHWSETVIVDSDQSLKYELDGEAKDLIPCTLFTPNVLQEKAITELRQYIPPCLAVANHLFGLHPFKKLDIIIVPACYDSLGMASPSVLYIAQSLLQGDYSMLIRFAHEVSHTWFGIVIGPKDWTEEWLTEGFCTYTEDVIHGQIMKNLKMLKDEDIACHREIRDFLKYRTLLSELQNTKQELQTLRPNKKGSEVQSGDDKNDSITYVINGMNPEKRFTQVHYLKGYFLLRHIEKKVGQTQFLKFLKHYVHQYHGQLVTSQDVIGCLFSICPELRDMGISEPYIYEQWLDNPGLPDDLKDYSLNKDNQIARCVIEQIQRIKDLVPKNAKIGRKKKRKIDYCGIFKELHADQVVLFLELLLDEERLPLPLLCHLREFYCLHSVNADIQHRWCELVVKHKLQQHYTDVKDFLINHQAMGVYLFGEMVISRNKRLKQLAEDCFSTLKDEMEPDPLKTVQMMLYGK